MPAFLDSRDLRLLIGSGVLMIVLLGLTFAVGPAPPQQSLGFPSSYSSRMGGRQSRVSAAARAGISGGALGKIAGGSPRQLRGRVADFGRANGKGIRERAHGDSQICFRRRTRAGDRRRRGESGSGHRCFVRRGVGPATQILSGAPAFADYARRARNFHGGARHVYVEHTSMARALREGGRGRGVVVSRRERRGHLVGFGVAFDERLDTRQEQSSIFLELRRRAIGCARVLG